VELSFPPPMWDKEKAIGARGVGILCPTSIEEARGKGKAWHK